MLDCREDWFRYLYRDPMRTFVKSPTFRTILASHIRKVQRSDISTWPPLALLGTYRVALKRLKDSSSWLDPKVRVLHSFGRGLSSLVGKVLFWRSQYTKMREEVLRRWRSYMTDMGITGPILVLLHRLSRQDIEFRRSKVGLLPQALPDQDVVTTQKLTGLALPSPNLSHYRLDGYVLPAQPFLDPTFLETFFTLLPWQSVSNLDDIPMRLSLPFARIFKGRDGQVIRLLSLRNLPQNNSRWDDDAKLLFSRFLDQVLHQVGSLQAP